MPLKVLTGDTKPRNAGVASFATEERCWCGDLSSSESQMRCAVRPRRAEGGADYTQQESHCNGKCRRLDTVGKCWRLEQQISTVDRYCRLCTAGRHRGGSQQTGHSRRCSQGQLQRSGNQWSADQVSKS